MPIFKKKTRGRRRSTSGEGGGALTLPKMLKSTLLALPAALGAGLLLLLAAAALLQQTANPGQYTAIVGTALLYLSAALHGMLTVRLARGRLPLFCGLLAGGVLLVMLMLLGLIFPRGAGAYQRPLIVGLYAALPCATVAGALLPTRRKRAKRRRKTS
ncbi:MAG: hypothetical protein E7644_03255 [Ruminococcaceae bacterium]|nr:hypothetical protein [Oscillospiraceae bacterium]